MSVQVSRPGERSWWQRAGAIAASMMAFAVLGGAPAYAQRVENGVAVFAALDKVTASISKLEAKLGESKAFGALKVTARACYSRSPTEPPKTTTFVEVDEVMLDGQVRRIFTGWMFAESPGLNALEHPVFDLWLTGCAEPKRTGVARKGGGAAPAGTDGEGAEPPRRRIRR